MMEELAVLLFGDRGSNGKLFSKDKCCQEEAMLSKRSSTEWTNSETALSPSVYPRAKSNSQHYI